MYEFLFHPVSSYLLNFPVQLMSYRSSSRKPNEQFLSALLLIHFDFSHEHHHLCDSHMIKRSTKPPAHPVQSSFVL